MKMVQCLNFCLVTLVPRHSAGGSYVCMYAIHPQEYMCKNIHMRTKLACAENIFLNLQAQL